MLRIFKELYESIMKGESVIKVKKIKEVSSDYIDVHYYSIGGDKVRIWFEGSQYGIRYVMDIIKASKIKEWVNSQGYELV